jgi:sugar phosphate isomerase/epimerase
MQLMDRVAVSSVTFRDEPLESALRRVRGLGFVRLDLAAIRHYCNHFDPMLVDVGEEACLRVRDAIAAHDMHLVSVTSFPANPLSPTLNGADWVEAVDAYVRMGIIGGARTLILPPGGPAPSPDRWRGTVQRVLPWLRDAAMRIVTAGMAPAIALQSNSLLRTSENGLDFLRVLELPSVGLAVDPAHLAAMGEDPAAALRALGDAVAFVVLRDTDGEDANLPPGGGTLDYPAILAALEEIDYTGPLVLAVDDVTLAPEVREGLLVQGWEYLEAA